MSESGRFRRREFTVMLSEAALQSIAVAGYPGMRSPARSRLAPSSIVLAIAVSGWSKSSGGRARGSRAKHDDLRTPRRPSSPMRVQPRNPNRSIVPP